MWRIAAVLAIVGCRAEEDGIARDDQFGLDYVAAACERMFACECSEPHFEDFETCEEELYDIFRPGQLAARRKGLKYDDECAQRRLELVESVACGTRDEEIPDGLVECLVYYGTVGAGEPCWAHDWRTSDCQQGLVCELEVCVDPEAAPTMLAEGQPCLTVPNGVCGDGTVCNYTGSQTCVVPAADGEPCSFEAPCGLQSFCLGTCMPLAEIGEACGDDSHCISRACDGTVCVAEEPLACAGIIVL